MRPSSSTRPTLSLFRAKLNQSKSLYMRILERRQQNLRMKRLPPRKRRKRKKPLRISHQRLKKRQRRNYLKIPCLEDPDQLTQEMMTSNQSNLKSMRSLIKMKTLESAVKRSLNVYLMVLRSPINFMLISSSLSYAELTSTRTDPLLDRSLSVMLNVSLSWPES